MKLKLCVLSKIVCPWLDPEWYETSLLKISFFTLSYLRIFLTYLTYYFFKEYQAELTFDKAASWAKRSCQTNGILGGVYRALEKMCPRRLCSAQLASWAITVAGCRLTQSNSHRRSSLPERFPYAQFLNFFDVFCNVAGSPSPVATPGLSRMF